MMQQGVQGENEGLNLKNGEERSLAEKREQTGRRATRGSLQGSGAQAGYRPEGSRWARCQHSN